jgi:hypothetical protein
MVPVEDMLLHEDADLGRVERLALRLREDGVLRNPPVTTALPGGGYVVLDGANRTTALAALGADVLPVQLVEYADVRLDVWSHFLLDAGALASRVQALGIPLRLLDSGADVVPERPSGTCYIAAGDDIYEIDVAARAAPVLSGIVGTYKGTVRIYRVPGLRPGQSLREQSDRLAREYGAAGTLIVFPMLTKGDILDIARGDEKLPTGVTRHVIAGRALRVDVPLEVLTSESPLAVKEAWLADYVRGKLLDNRVRYYPEATFLFDE